MTTLPVEDAATIARCASLAQRIWTEWYTPIIGTEQVRYMLQTVQSAEAITGQIEAQGYRYRLVQMDGEDVGYFAIVVQQTTLHISKLYVLKEARAHGVGRYVIDQALLDASQNGCDRLELTVNRHNPSKRFYTRMGFENAGPLVQEIGGGFVMDDYVLRRLL